MDMNTAVNNLQKTYPSLEATCNISCRPSCSLKLSQSIDDFVTSPAQMFGRVPSQTLVASIQERFGNVTAIVVALELDPHGKAGLQWSSRLSGPSTVTSGTPCDIEIIVREIRPASLILPGFGQDDGLSP